MGYKYLNTFNKIITESQRLELAEIINAKIKQGELDPSDFEPELEKALAKIDPNNKPIIKLRLVDTSYENPKKISSQEYNDLIEEAHVDLITLFKEANLSADAISRHEQISKDFISSLRRQVKQLQARIDAFKSAATTTKGFEAVVEESFVKPIGKTRNTTISDGSLRLAAAPGYPQVYNSGPIIEEVRVDRYPKENQGGVDYASTPDHDIELNYNYGTSEKRLRQQKQIIRSKDMMRSGTTYGTWAEVALADAPVYQTIDGRTYYGVIALLRIKYNGTFNINTIVVDPYSDSEILIPRVRYKTSASDWKIVTYLNENNRVAPLTGRGSDVIRLEGFNTLEQVQELEIMLLQSNSTLRKFILNENQLQDIELWDEILEQEYEDLEYEYTTELDKTISNHRTDLRLPEKPVKGSILDKQLSKINSAQGVNEILSVAQDAFNLSARQLNNLSQSVTGDTDLKLYLQDKIPQLREFHKHEYIYGAYSIIPQNIKFVSASGIWESPIYDTKERVITQVGLDADMFLPSGTSVAYSIVDAEKRVNIPILPSNTNLVYERIGNPRVNASGLNTLEWETRFPAVSGSAQLFVNLENVEDVGYFYTNDLTAGTKILATGIPLSPTIPYVLTCQYEPEKNSKYWGAHQFDHEHINLLRNMNLIEASESNAENLDVDRYKINLAHFPFIDYSRFTYDTGFNNRTSHLRSGGEFVFGNLPMAEIVGQWMYARTFGSEARFYTKYNVMWNVDELITRRYHNMSKYDHLECYCLNEGAIKLLRFENIDSNLKYCIKEVKRTSTTKEITIGYYNPPLGGFSTIDPGWQNLLTFSWTGTDPDRDTIYETSALNTPNIPNALKQSKCRIKVDWGELFNDELFPFDLPEPESYEPIEEGGVTVDLRPIYAHDINNKLHPLSGYLDHPNMLPNIVDEITDRQRTLSSVHTLRMKDIIFFGSPDFVSGVYDLPRTTFPDLYSSCQIAPEIVSDRLWRELEYYGWLEEIDASGWVQRDDFKSLFRPVRLLVNRQYATDITAYKQTEEQDGLDSYELSNEYQFYLFGDKLYTNYDFREQTDKTIEVDYAYLTDGIQLKAILHSNRTGPSDFTPIINNLRLKFRSRS